MERNYNNEFERFLKENADQYRLYPSAKVWNGIHASLHSRRKWYGLGILLLLITGTLITLLITNSPKQTPVAINQTADVNKSDVQKPKDVLPERKEIAGITGDPENFIPKKAIKKYQPVLSSKKDESVYSPVYRSKGIKNVQTTSPVQNNVSQITSDAVQNNTSDPIIEKTSIQPHTSLQNDIQNTSPVTINITDQLTDQDIISSTGSAQKQTVKPTPAALANVFDWTIESVLNSYSSNKITKRFGLQFNFTPTISYRKLTENKAFLRSAAAQSGIPYTYAALYDINSAVTHKPDMGLEMGLTAKYSLASNFKIKTGIQFNVSRYDIKAFNYPIEIATIALNGGSQVDSFVTISNYRNFNGYKSNWLQNLYFQLSVPVGVEVKLAGDEKVQFGVAGTIQPTYILGERAYLLSTDYKNYTEVPWLIRRWNVNTAIETFVSYSTGKLKWQVGPQMRYQLLSSFRNKYPVKENLFDFGLKVGISLNNQ